MRLGWLARAAFLFLEEATKEMPRYSGGPAQRRSLIYFVFLSPAA
jgi:hypothetical protein